MSVTSLVNMSYQLVAAQRPHHYKRRHHKAVGLVAETGIKYANCISGAQNWPTRLGVTYVLVIFGVKI